MDRWPAIRYTPRIGPISLNGDFYGSFPFEPRFVEAGDVRVACVDEGPRDAPAILMLHGNPTWSYMYRRPIAMLAEAGYRCVAVDNMGFGRSDKPRTPARYTLAGHIGNVLAVIDSLELRDLVVVGHDWGGPIGIGAMLERLDQVRGMVLMNTWAWELPSFLPPFLREFRNEGLGEILALGGNLVVESIPGGMMRRDVDTVMLDAYRAPFPDYWSRVGTLAFMRDIPLSERDASASTFARMNERLPRLADLPAALVWGMRDPVFQPVFLDQWRELLPGARVTELERASHYLVEDAPDEVCEAIRALASEVTVHPS
jgi:cis-3-alkyl-4-acyloxetan-2-one decarboxylase